MKTIFAFLAAGCALGVASGAAAQSTGWVAGEYSRAAYFGDFQGFAVAGSATLPMSSAWTVQLDGRVERLDHRWDALSGEVTAHAVYALGDRARVGVFVGGMIAKTDDVPDDRDVGEAYGVGVEGLLTVSPSVALYGGVVAAKVNPRYDSFYDASVVSGRAEVRWTLTDATRIDGFAQTGELDFDGFRGFRQSSAGLGVEHQFASPLSAYANYEHSWQESYSRTYEIDGLRVGLRYNFGGTVATRRSREMSPFSDVLSGSRFTNYLNGPGIGFYD